MEKSWPIISYFNSGTAFARHFMADLERVDGNARFELYRRISDGTHWRLDGRETGNQRFLVFLEEPRDWASFDASSLEKLLLLEHRGVATGESCRWRDCGAATLVGSAFCVDHAYEMGARK
jgi:hypothetical protein